MPLYTFHCYNAAGAPLGLETVECESETQAAAHARRVLAEHGSAVQVVVCLGDQEVATLKR